MTAGAPDKFDLYRQAVQFPAGAVNFMINTYASWRDGAWPTCLREDFAGTAAVAQAWVRREHDHQALAVEIDRETLDRAASMDRLACVCADVFDVREPLADVIAALNFSTFIFHNEDAMQRYFAHARQCLKPDGLLVIDAFGGSTPGVQMRPIHPPAETGIAPFEYQWEQRSYDPASARIDCRIHFKTSDGREWRDAFCYDWRLWSPPELIALMRAAGFADAAVYRDDDDTGVFQPAEKPPKDREWVAYIVGVR